jgi:hypothetical protein
MAAKALARDGRSQLTDWQSGAMVAQGAWVTLFCQTTDFSFTALQISMSVPGMLGVVRPICPWITPAWAVAAQHPRCFWRRSTRSTWAGRTRP